MESANIAERSLVPRVEYDGPLQWALPVTFSEQRSMTIPLISPPEQLAIRTGSAALLGVVLAFALFAPPTVAAQDPSANRVGPRISGSIGGLAFDSVTARPLDDALVMLMDAGGLEIRDQVRTDSQGRFLIEDVPVGEHVVVLAHDRLEDLSLTPILRTVQVQASTESTVPFHTPSLATLWPLFCEGRQSAGTGVVYGRTLDSVTGVAQPEVSVAAQWRESAGRVGTVSSETDASGAYTLCGIPGRTRVTLTARFIDGSVVEETVELNGAVVRPQDLMSGLGRPSAIQGFLFDAQSGEPIPTAVVTLAGTNRRAVTGADGSFRFPDLEQGAYLLEMEHLAYGRQQKELLLGSRTLEVDARFSAQAIELEGVTVSVLQPQLEDRGFYQRRRTVGASRATILTGEELMQRDSTSLPWALRNMPATEMRMSAPNGPTLQHRSGGQTCNMPVFLNNMLMVDVFNMASLDPDEVLGIEIYPPEGAGFSTLPLEYRTRAEYPGCGGVLIWTR